MREAYYYPGVPHPDIHRLTDVEWNVLLHISNGLNAKDISVIENVMPKSIDNCKNRIGKKLGLQGYGSLTRFALKNRITLLAWNLLLHPEKGNRHSSQPMNMVSMNSMDMEKISGGRKIVGDLHSDFLALMRSRSSVADLGNRSVKLFDTFI